MSDANIHNSIKKSRFPLRIMAAITPVMVKHNKHSAFISKHFYVGQRRSTRKAAE